MSRRKIEVLVLSDIHLGTYGCHAEELCTYLDSIDPKKIILNGDIVDIWQFKKRYWPQSHTEVLHRLMDFLSQGVEIFYITGNHDELIRKFSDFHLSNFHIIDKLVMELDGKKVWIFHGDVFDVTMQYSKWLAKFGGYGYDFLIYLNRTMNAGLRMIGRGNYSFSKAIKNSVKKAIKFVRDFEITAADLAIQNQYDYVVMGHIHTPEQKTIYRNNSKVVYLNSGDWVENLTSLEYQRGNWNIFRYPKTESESLSVPDPILANSKIAHAV